MRNTLVLVWLGLGASWILAGYASLPKLAAALLCLAVTLGLAGIGAPDWLSQALRRLPSGGRTPNEIQARAFLMTAALAALAFGAWVAVQ